MKKIISLTLILALILSMSTIAYADTSAPTQRDLYTEKAIERVSIDGIMYTYKYYMDSNGERTISISNNNSSEDIVVYDEEAGNVYLNDEVVATAADIYMPQSRAIKTGWSQTGSESFHVTWKKGVVTGVGGVIAAMGLGALSVLSAGAAGGTIHIGTLTHQ